MELIRRVGFIGVGHMGAPMAAQLLRRGFEVTAYDAEPRAAAAFQAANGGKIAPSPAALGSAAQAVITMLPTGAIVQQVLTGADGIGATLAPGAIAIDMSTSDPRDTTATGAALAARGIAFVDAPVMGGVKFALDGSLDIMAGGDAAIIDRCMPLFDALGRRTFRCGGLGAGHALKAIANFVNATTFSAVLEAMTIGRRYGLDTGLMTEALTAMCGGRQHPLEKKVIPQVLTRRYATGMALSLIAKDLRIASGMAREAGAVAPLADCISALWTDATTRVGANVDQSEIVRYWEEQSGVKL
jgi:3-hydroxyisobutyrate dehydrogenase